MPLVDLRSDTVTRPGDAMRRAMASAPVGDDVYGEDPTVRALEETTAGILGKEDALFVPSGTMANQIGLGLLAGPGTEVLVEQDCHVMNYEAGAASALWGITLRPMPGPRGRLEADRVRGAGATAGEQSRRGVGERACSRTRPSRACWIRCCRSASPCRPSTSAGYPSP